MCIIQIIIMILINKNEKILMDIIIKKCENTDTCLVKPQELIDSFPAKNPTDEQKLNALLKSLELDNYFELINTDKNGEKVFCIILSAKGMGYTRQKAQDKKALYFKIGLAIGSAIVTFIVGMILRGIFS